MPEILLSSPIPHYGHVSLSIPHYIMAEILLSSPIPHWEYVSLRVHRCVHGWDPPLLPHPPLGTCVTESPPLCTWLRSFSPPPSPTGVMCHWAIATAYMAEILHSSPIPHWGHVSLGNPHCIHGWDTPLLPHPPLGKCVAQHTPLDTWLRSSSPPPSPTGDMCHWASPTVYMAEIVLSLPIPHCMGTCVTEGPPLHTWLRSSSSPPSSTGDMSPILHWGHVLLSIPRCIHGTDPLSSPISHWEHVWLSIPHCVHGTDPPLLPNLPPGTCVTECPSLHTQLGSSSSTIPTGDMCHWAPPHCVHG